MSNKDKRMNLRLSNTDFETIYNASLQCDLSLSEFIRRALIEKATQITHDQETSQCISSEKFGKVYKNLLGIMNEVDGSNISNEKKENIRKKAATIWEELRL